MLHITIIPILSNNYAYLIQSGDVVGIVDPGESKPIIDYLDDHKLRLDWVINTHHHDDHTGGNRALIDKYNARLAAPAECGDDIDVILKDNEKFDFGDSSFNIILAKGHTAGHIMLYDQQSKVLFSGDTLFAMGCGRVFEGTHNEMFAAMKKIKHLPLDTQIYCGHEYTLSNAQFASYLMPHNNLISDRIEKVKIQKCTVPTSLDIEMKTNPFLIADTIEDFIKYRVAKDKF